MQEELCFVASRKHPRLNYFFNEDRFKQEKFVVFETTGKNFSETKLAIQNVVGERDIMLKSNSFFTLLSMIEATDCIGVIPLWMFNKFKSSFDLTQLNSDKILSTQPIYMIFRKSSDNDTLLEHLIEKFTDPHLNLFPAS